MKKKLINRVIYTISVILFLIFSLAPIIWCFIISITPEYEMLKNTENFLPSSIYWGNYVKILTFGSSANRVLFGGLMNSIKISVLTVLMGIPIATMAGYAFSRYKFKDKKFIINFVMITIVIPVFTTIIPIYASFAEFGFLDKLFYVSIIYVSAFIPINTWIIMNYFNAIPKELWEAAKVDGCNEIQTFFKVILPISFPIILTCALMMFIMSWNQFQIPLILLSTPDNKVVTMILSDFVSRDDISYGIIALCGLAATIVPAIITVIFRNFLIEGLTKGSVKG